MQHIRKHTGLLLAVLMLSACNTVYRDQDVDAPTRKVEIEALLDGAFEVEYAAPARATENKSIDQSGLTRFVVFDGQKMLCNQEKGEAGFGTPTLDLEYGHHELRFFAHSGADDKVDYKKDTVVLKNLFETYYRAYPLDVTATTDAQQVVLTRAYSQVRVTIEDAIAQDVCSIYTALNPIYTSFELSEGTMLAGGKGYSKRFYVQNMQGQTGTFYDVLPLALADQQVQVTISAKKQNGTLLASKKANITLRRNTIVNVHGKLFTVQSAPAFSVQSLWADTLSFEF